MRSIEQTLVALLTVTLVLGPSCSSSSSSTEPDESLDRLRERLDERASEREAEVQADRTIETDEGPVQPLERPSLLLEPRYGGALPDDDPLVLGVFRFRTHRDPIIDGDTVAVAGLDASLRLFGIDTEETFHGNDELRMRAYADFDDYVRIIYEEEGHMPKFATPMGEIAHDFCREFFAGDTQIRLEFDELDRTRGYFDRYLVYVYALRDEGWINYNLEAVRAGMSPYFTKYGYSARFHDQFLQAEAEARAEGRGVWDPTLRHYPDYDVRRAWWDRRADAIRHFKENYGDRPEYVEVAVDDDWRRLPELEGQTVTVFGSIANFHYDWTPPRVTLSHRRGDDFTLVGFADGVFERYDLERYEGEYIYVRGRLNFYEGRPQLIVDQGIEVWTEP